jgi:pimeloyl-ACP methyl ester carboxylesterase
MTQSPTKSPLQDFGLHCIQKPRSDLSIVFVHGFLSGGEAAWGQPSWPELLAKEPEVHNAGVFVFSYQTALSSRTYSIGDVVDALREHFNLEGLWEQSRLVFVCHSMGGIVVRRFIVVNQAKFIERSYPLGLFLVASPSLGSRDANLAGLLALLLQHTQALALRFSQTNTWLNDLDRDFINLKESGRLPLVGKELVEDRPIPVRRWFGLRRQVVEPFAAAKYFGEAFKVPGSDHISISKPETSGAVQHQLLKLFIAEFSEFAELRNGIEAIQENLDRFEEIRPEMNRLVGRPVNLQPHAVTHRLSDSGNAVEFVGYGELKQVTIDDLAKLPPDDRRAIAASNSAMRKLMRDWNAIIAWSSSFKGTSNNVRF